MPLVTIPAATKQCVMLGLYSFIRKSEARTQVSDTKLYPHLEAVLDSKVQVWAVKLKSLLERSVATWYLNNIGTVKVRFSGETQTW